MPHVLSLSEVRRTDLPRVGGKGANLGELVHAGFHVPPGFCVTTEAWQALVAHVDPDALFGPLEALDPADTDALRREGARAREQIRALPIPPEVDAELVAAWTAAGVDRAYAVRSSATAEDLPQASFAGQQDTILNVRGVDAIRDAVRACWASLFTDRAISYRAMNGYPHRAVQLALVVQELVVPDSAGIAFSADPLTQDRNTASIDAGWGLGEGLVSGRVDADLYRVDRRTGEVMERRIGRKLLAIRANADGGTVEAEVDEVEAARTVLDDATIAELVAVLGRAETLFGSPQDMEWALRGRELFVLQSRPITTLFPRLEAPPEDPDPHVYVSFGHVQVMTDPMAPLSLSTFQRMMSFGGPPERGRRNGRAAGGRLYVDLTPLWRLGPLRRRIPTITGAVDRHVSAALGSLATRPRFTSAPAHALGLARVLLPLLGPLMLKIQAQIWLFPPEGKREVVDVRFDEALAAIDARIAAAAPGAARVREASDCARGLMVTFVQQGARYAAAGILARAFLRLGFGDRLPRADLDAIDRALPGNVTTAMDLELADLADLARQHPDVARRLVEVPADQALAGIEAVAGGPEFRGALDAWLARYGMRGPSEIDLLRTRYAESPAVVVQMIAGNLRSDQGGSHRELQARMTREASEAAARLATHGWRVRRLVRVLRELAGLRETPKYFLVRAFDRFRRVARDEGRRLVDAGVLTEVDDVFFLDWDELAALCESRDPAIRETIAARREAHRGWARVVPPRVITSDGEVVIGRIAKGSEPEGALVGTAASAGVVEGVVRVVLDPATTTLHAGEILVAPFTDPGWTPLFVHAAGLVMEVGGLMTHGSVVARECGIPAVVSVPDCTKALKTGMRVRVNGDEGWVQILEP